MVLVAWGAMSIRTYWAEGQSEPALVFTLVGLGGIVALAVAAGAVEEALGEGALDETRGGGGLFEIELSFGEVGDVETVRQRHVLHAAAT